MIETTDSGGNGLGQNPFTVKGGIQDRVTGWVHFGQCWYDPATGRFTQPNTLDAPLDPSNGNRYAYAADDPINLADPTGNDSGCFTYGYDACDPASDAGSAPLGSADCSVVLGIAVGYAFGTLGRIGSAIVGGVSSAASLGIC